MPSMLPRQSLTHLKVGTGKPWAGQDKLKASAEGLSIEELLSPTLNIGADPPMGSEAFFGENNFKSAAIT